MSSFSGSHKRRFGLVGLCAALAVAGFAAGAAYAGQPRMHAALNYLRNARAELVSARADKAGHREAAIKLVDEAIGEVQAGISAGM